MTHSSDEERSGSVKEKTLHFSINGQPAALGGVLNQQAKLLYVGHAEAIALHVPVMKGSHS